MHLGDQQSLGKCMVLKVGIAPNPHLCIIAHVHCSEEVMTLTAAGKDTHTLFVKRGEKVNGCLTPSPLDGPTDNKWCGFLSPRPSGCCPTAFIPGTCILWLFCQGHMGRSGPNGSI